LALGGSLRDSYDINAAEKAVIDQEKCTACGTCIRTCRFSAIMEAEKPLVIPFSCEGCGACALVCPEKAIEIRDVTNGRIEVYDADHMVTVAGGLLIGESGSGRIVDIVKNRAREAAEAVGAEFLVIDGPPGIGCPVISSLKGSDFLIVVAEHSASAVHDMMRLLDVSEHFGISTGMVINKADMHPKSRNILVDLAQGKSLPVLAEIPYDLSIMRAVCQGVPVVKAYPDSPSSHALRQLSEALIREVFRVAGRNSTP
jgi:MinD superfamily P-loop ATPase